MSEVKESLRAKVITSRKEYDSFFYAVKIANEEGLSNEQIQVLIQGKSVAKKYRIEADKELKSVMPSDTNMVKLTDNWYALQYVNGKASIIMDMVPMTSEDAITIQRNPERERHLSNSDMSNIVCALKDQVALDIYNSQVTKRAREIILDYLGVEIKDKQDSQNMHVSVHSGLRWVQRKLGILNEVKAEEYRRSNVAQIEKDILLAYSSADLLWVGEDAEYYFDEDNIMYVVGDNTIITLYEENFGFNKSINRRIVFDQVGVLRETQEHLKETERKHEELSEDTSRGMDQINNQLALLEDEIELLTARKTVLSVRYAAGEREVRSANARHQSEFNKLFKKWG